MADLPNMTKHKGFLRMPGTGVQFTIRRANPKGVTPLKVLPRKARPGTKEHRIDAAFLHALWHHFARTSSAPQPGCRPTEPSFRPRSRRGGQGFRPAFLRGPKVIDERVARQSFPESFEDVFEV